MDADDEVEFYESLRRDQMGPNPVVGPMPELCSVGEHMKRYFALHPRTPPPPPPTEEEEDDTDIVFMGTRLPPTAAELAEQAQSAARRAQLIENGELAATLVRRLESMTRREEPVAPTRKPWEICLSDDDEEEVTHPTSLPREAPPRAAEAPSAAGAAPAHAPAVRRWYPAGCSE